ncbi:MAG TPA: antibiotic biosynthesis monooxygenase [Terriglobia bacterium]|nr:antibiotic biosynthesis monooxygenase [Terriglobia bacterium]
MLIIHVHVRVRPEFVEEFKLATVENAQNSVKEPGIARFDVVERRDDPTRFVLVEVYRSPDATALHKESAHYRLWKERVESMLAEPRSRVEYAAVFPGDQGW